MDIKKIKQLIRLFEQHPSIYEIEIKEDKESIRLCKQSSVIASNLQQIPSTIITTPSFTDHHQDHVISSNQYQKHQSSTNKSSLDIPKNINLQHNENNNHDVSSITRASEIFILKSPMVGTFYRSASPEAKPFVSVGDRVNIGDTLCIIEAMKMFNQIEAEFAGTIDAILVESGQPIEFEQPLFNIIPDDK